MRGALIASLRALFAGRDEEPATPRDEVRARWVFVFVLLVLGACAAYPVVKGARTAPVALEGPGFDCRISRVVDGDTVKLACADGSATSARLMGFDTPETYKPHCREEYTLGKRATRALQAKIAGASDIRLTGHGRDKYDRLLVRLYLDGQDVADEMIARGLAVPYGGGKRIDWCARLT